MVDTGPDGPPTYRTEVEVGGGQTAMHSGSGDQYNRFGGHGPQLIALLVVLVGAVAGILLSPAASGSQVVSYVLLVVICAIVAGFCLWWLLGRTRRKAVGYLGLISGVIVSGVLAAAWQRALAGHGDVAVNVTSQVTPHDVQSLADNGRATMVVDGPSPRSFLRVRISLDDHYPDGVCAAMNGTRAEIRLLGDGAKSITLSGDHQTGDIDLRGARQHVELEAVVRAGEGCVMDLHLESVVLHDNEWWLP
ncbi:hypothetical protein [Kitasatospora sp. NPDC087315]|uniref:hypothetical protein n=1 Tax=Kitasatospora sp. NPDC087315 TaxID=3364069 RepID=UPI0037FBEFBB